MHSNIPLRKCFESELAGEILSHIWTRPLMQGKTSVNGQGVLSCSHISDFWERLN